MKTIGNKSKLLAELVNLHEDKVRDDEFTVLDYWQELKKAGVQISNRAAYAKLYRMCNDGKLKKRVVIINGSQANVFSKA